MRKRSSEFHDIEKRINLDNLIYVCKTKGRSLKDFSVYQTLTDLFKNLRDGNINPKEVLKNQISFKSGLSEIIKGNPKSRTENQISVIQDVENFFCLREKIIDFSRDYSFF